MAASDDDSARDSRLRRSGSEGLQDVLVVTVKKSFWASQECEIFPHRVYAPIVWGHSSNLLNTLLLAARAALALFRRRPKLILFGSAHRLVPLALVLKRFNLIRSGVVATNLVFFGRRLGRHADRVIVYSRREAAACDNCRFFPIPADGDFRAVVPFVDDGPYIFSGGGTQRDFRSLVDAVADLDIRLIVVTFSPKTLGVEDDLPRNCRVLWRMPSARFLSLMAGSLFVVVPLQQGAVTGGHTTIAQALRLGKAVVTTRGVDVEDYVRDGREGLLVDAGDVSGYRTAVLSLIQDEELRRSCEDRARERAPELSYASFARAIEALCNEVLEEREHH